MEKVITVDIGASKIRIQAVNKDGGFEKEEMINSVGLNLDNESLVKLLAENIKPIIDLGKTNISAISIAAPGLVDSDKKIINKLTNIKNINDLDIGKYMKVIFDLPIFLLNDADAGTLGEWWLGQGKNLENIVFLTLGTGVGVGIILKNKLLPNLELGHKPLAINDPVRKCACGNTNDAESFLGTHGLSEIYTEVFGLNSLEPDNKEKHSLSPKMRAGVRSGDKQWLAVQEKYTGYLALFLKDIISTYQPEIIILGGGIAYNNEHLLHSVRKKIDPAEKTKIIRAQFENSVNLGAAKYALEILFKL